MTYTQQSECFSRAEDKLVTDIEMIYQRSYSALSRVFKEEFQESKSFKDMMMLMNQNMVEFQFMKQAGLAWRI